MRMSHTIFMPSMGCRPEPQVSQWLNRSTRHGANYSIFEGKNPLKNLGSMLNARRQAISWKLDRYFYVEDDCYTKYDNALDLMSWVMDLLPQCGIVTMWNTGLDHYNRDHEYACRMYSNPAQFMLYRTLPDINIESDAGLSMARSDTHIAFSYAQHGFYAVAINRYINFVHLRPVTRSPERDVQEKYFQQKWGVNNRAHMFHRYREFLSYDPRQDIHDVGDKLDEKMSYRY